MWQTCEGKVDLLMSYWFVFDLWPNCALLHDAWSPYPIPSQVRESCPFSFTDLMIHGCWLHLVNVTRNSTNTLRLRRWVCVCVCVCHSSVRWVSILIRACPQSLIWCVCVCVCVCDAVLLEGVLSGRCGKDGSAQTGQVSICACLFVWVLSIFLCLNVHSCVCVFIPRLHEQLHESDDAAQYYIIYIQDIFSCGVSVSLSYN